MGESHWDIVNFDSGGSAAIAVDGEMLNLPGRGSVRPVEDAMLAVSLAPESNKVARIAFSKSAINTSVIAIAPLRMMAFNEYTRCRRSVGRATLVSLPLLELSMPKEYIQGQRECRQKSLPRKTVCARRFCK